MTVNPDALENQNLAERVKALRCRMGWCQSDLARRLGVSSDQVKDWELGQTQPSSEYLLVLDDLFHQASVTQLDIEDKVSQKEE
jgi:DNA-binding transcriptional regulator YiaG